MTAPRIYRDAMYNIALRLPVRETLIICKANEYRSICSNNTFWVDKAARDFELPEEDFNQLEGKNGFEKYQGWGTYLARDLLGDLRGFLRKDIVGRPSLDDLLVQDFFGTYRPLEQWEKKIIDSVPIPGTKELYIEYQLAPTHQYKEELVESDSDRTAYEIILDIRDLYYNNPIESGDIEPDVSNYESEDDDDDDEDDEDDEVVNDFIDVTRERIDNGEVVYPKDLTMNPVATNINTSKIENGRISVDITGDML